MTRPTAAAVLAEVHRAGRTGVYRMTSHADDRLRERRLSNKDLRNALRTATRCAWQDVEQTWRVEGGTDVDGEPTTCAVVIRNGVLVVTIY